MSNWTSTRLGDLLKSSYERSSRSDEFPVLTSSRSGLHLQSEYFNRVVASKDNTGYRVIRKGQFTYRAMSDDGFFRFNRLSEQEAGIISPAYEVFECETNKADPVFMDYLLNSVIVMSKIYGAAQGGTRLSLRLSTLSEFEAEIPSLSEQKKIAEILSGIDILVDKKNHLIQKKKQIQKSLSLSLLHLGTNRLGGDSGQRMLGEILTLSRGVDITKATSKPGPFPVVSSSGISGWHDSFTAESGVVVGRKGSIGNVHYIESKHWVHDTSLGVIDYKGNNKRFVYHLLRNMDLAQYGTKSGSPSLNRNDLHPLPVRCPSLSQQERIASILDGGNEEIRKLRFEIDTLGNLKKAISQDLLSGRKRVSV